MIDFTLSTMKKNLSSKKHESQSEKDQIVQMILIAEKKLMRENTEENTKKCNILKYIYIKRLKELGKRELKRTTI